MARKIALAALCATALTALSQTAQANGVFAITGGSALGSFPGYGPLQTQNNVINDSSGAWTGTQLNPVASGGYVTGSTIQDASAGGDFLKNATLTVTGLGGTQQYTVSWQFAGNEAYDVNNFSITGANVVGSTVAAGGYNSGAPSGGTNNYNSNYTPAPYSPTQGSPIAMGLTAYQGSGGADTPGFKLLDAPNSGSVTNGGATVGLPTPSLLFSYATFSGGIYTLTSSATNIVVFGFNDNGAPDDNHDDFVGIATLLPGGNDLPTPLPAALPLFGSVLGGGLLFRRLRNRRQAGAKGAVA
jgi:hypothetical protein